MAFEMLIGLSVKDDEIYTQYRKAMKPILEKYGGGFRYDFQIAKTLASEAEHPINRVFTIYFRDEAAKIGFFADPAYKVVRETYFDTSVAATSILANYST